MQEVSFHGLALAAQPGRVMTPRRATERPVTAALERLGSRPARVVDVGTGCGASAVAIPTARSRYPDLVSEPAAAVFGSGDGLEPYRRLLTACAERLDDDADVLIQLHRRVLAAKGAELGALHEQIESFTRPWAPVPQLAAA